VLAADLGRRLAMHGRERSHPAALFIVAFEVTTGDSEM
jgi:hypothetical protein